MTAQCHAAVNAPRKEGEMDIATELVAMKKMTASDWGEERKCLGHRLLSRSRRQR